jgi:hypothetical protein
MDMLQSQQNVNQHIERSALAAVEEAEELERQQGAS